MMRAVRAVLPCAIAGACGSGPAGGSSPLTAEPLTIGSDTGGDDTDGDGSTSSSTGAASTGAGSADESDGGGPSFDVAAGDDTGECFARDEICCLMDGDIPPHALLDAFLAAYPTPNMPKTGAAIEGFDPMADGHTMAWHDANSGDEFIDPLNGGIVDGNVENGRAASRHAAEMVLPLDAIVLDVREDPVVTDNPGNDDECLGSTGATGTAGIGWAWGSILFQAADQSIQELAYLYIGYCVGTQDLEAFFYSEASVEICAPPG
jgi:hypothetical protein